MLIKSTGTMKYGPGIRAYVEIDKYIGIYYHRLIPKCYNALSQRYPSHITVVRTGIEMPPNMQYWWRHEDEEIEFQYENRLYTNGVYFWIEVISEDISNIRQELGLPKFRDDLSHDPDFQYYHITVANLKHLK